MRHWALSIAVATIACSARQAALDAMSEPEQTTLRQFDERGLEPAPAVPPLRGEVHPEQWDPAKLFIDDLVIEEAVACLYDANTILAQMTHTYAETVYTVTLRHPPGMTVSSEGFVDDANWMRSETRAGVATYEAKFREDHDDFRAIKVRLEAPSKLRPCRQADATMRE